MMLWERLSPKNIYQKAFPNSSTIHNIFKNNINEIVNETQILQKQKSFHKTQYACSGL